MLLSSHLIVLIVYLISTPTGIDSSSFYYTKLSIGTPREQDATSFSYEKNVNFDNERKYSNIGEELFLLANSPENDNRTVSTESAATWNCGSSRVTINSCTINDCNRDPCHVRAGSVLTAWVSITPTVPASTLKCSIFVQKGLIKRTFNCPYNDMCSSSGMACPLQPGASYTFPISIGIPPNVPKWNWYVAMKMWGENELKICIATHIQIV